MFSKIFASISALLLVAITIMPLSKVQAQGLVEYALILVVVGFNKGEKAALYWRTNPASSRAGIMYSDFDGASVMYIDVTEDASSDCTQGVALPEPDYVAPGINVLALTYRDDGFLVISGTGYDEDVEVELKPCFEGRVVAQAGVPIPPTMVDRVREELASNPSGSVGGIPRIVSFAISDAASGDTKTYSGGFPGRSDYQAFINY